MKCIVHIGPPKTGSTFLQAFLRLNKAVLADSGILAIADQGMSNKFAHMFKTDAAILKLLKRRHKKSGSDQAISKQEIQQTREQPRRFIDKKIRQHNPDTIVFSCESLAMLGMHGLKEMRRYLEEIASEYRFVIYLRRPDFKATSGYKNRVKQGGFTGEVNSRYLKIYDDEKTIRRFGQVFGLDRICPIISQDSHPDRDRSKGHVETFLKVLYGDVDTSQFDFVIPDRRNTAWDYRAIHYMRAFNVMAEKNPEYEKYRKPLASLLTRQFKGGEKIRISKSLAKKIISRYQGGFEFIRRQYFPEQKTLFHMDFSMCDGMRPSQPFGTDQILMVSLKLMEELMQQQAQKS